MNDSFSDFLDGYNVYIGKSYFSNMVVINLVNYGSSNSKSLSLFKEVYLKFIAIDSESSFQKLKVEINSKISNKINADYLESQEKN